MYVATDGNSAPNKIKVQSLQSEIILRYFRPSVCEFVWRSVIVFSHALLLFSYLANGVHGRALTDLIHS